MKRRVLFITLFLAFLGGVWLLAILTQPPQPSYQGKPLTYWLHQLHSVNLADQPPARVAVQQIGSNAIPTLLRLMRKPDSWTKVRFLNRAYHFPHMFALLAAIPFAPNKNNYEADLGFEQLGTNARPAMPELIQIYEANPNAISAEYIPFIFIRAGVDDAATASVLLRVAAASTNGTARVFAFRVLSDFPTNSFPVITNMLHDPDQRVRFSAYVALQYLLQRPLDPHMGETATNAFLNFFR